MAQPSKSELVQFPNDNHACAIYCAPGTPARSLVDALALPRPRGLVILNGGTAQLDAALAAQLGLALGDGLARLVAEESLTVITGGTEAGIFHLFGQGPSRWGRTAPCILCSGIISRRRAHIYRRALHPLRAATISQASDSSAVSYSLSSSTAPDPL